MNNRILKVAVLCGGPSLERGISLNSARSLCDHLHSENIFVVPIYFDHNKKAFQISRSQLYSNTPSDFDFKLQSTSRPLSESALHKLLKSVDIVFPVMHGPFGEDGEIQKILEKHGVPYIGSDKKACRMCFDKYRANEYIKEQGFFTLPSSLLKIHEPEQHAKIIECFFEEHDVKRAVVKPATGGSSIGVHSVSSPEHALEAAQTIFRKRMDTRVVIEPFCEGIEFTVIILQNRFGQPVAIFPTEIEMDYDKNQIFDYRRKYLATNQRKYHCPPRFSSEITEKIQIQAEQLFMSLGMRDFARFDGWLMPDGNLWFSDFNPISGMEQNSFLYLQAAQIGFSHRDILTFIVRHACERYGIDYPEEAEVDDSNKQQVNVLFGGKTSERQVSVMSGTNVWLKLRKSKKYLPRPFLLDTDNKTVWRLPYSKTLNHTVEEISETCHNAAESEAMLKPLRRRVLTKIAAKPGHLNEELFLPEKMTLNEFIDRSDFVFIGLHGGIGENGVLQGMLEKKKVKFNGSGSKASAICMDKFETGKKIAHLEKEGIFVPKKIVKSRTQLKKMSDKDIGNLWKKLKQEIGHTFIVKPRDDGCSTGIVKISALKDLLAYITLVQEDAEVILPGTFANQHAPIEMPNHDVSDFMFEQFIQTDKVRVVQDEIKWQTVSGWIEITMGILSKDGKLYALNPSLAIASNLILSLEEKFQGGTGVNITPPPQPFVKKKAIDAARQRMEMVAETLGISGYARIDAFMHVETGELMIIEANSTPGLTPSTVIYHQALAEKPMMYPTEFLEKIIEEA